MATPLEELTAVDPDLLEKTAKEPLLQDPTSPVPTQRQSARIKADDLSRRGIAFYTTPTGPKEITDPTQGIPLTGFDKRNKIAWDAKGEPQKISFSADTGEPQLTPAYQGAPQRADKAGNLYAAPPGLPWQQVGEDTATKDRLRRESQAKLNRETDTALAPFHTEAAAKVRDALRAAKSSTKNTAALFQSIGVPLADEAGQPLIDIGNPDPAVLKTHIESSFNREYASDAANAKPLFGGGRLSSEAEAVRKGIDQRKQRAMEIAASHLSAVDQAKRARDEFNTISAQRRALREGKLDAVNARREEAGLAAMGIPSAGAQDTAQILPQPQGEGASSVAHNDAPAGATPAPATIPPVDRSFGSALRQGIDQPLEAIGTTMDVFGIPGGGLLRGAVNAPANYESASERFINPKEGDFTIPTPLGRFAPAQIPRAIVEQFGQLGGSIISSVAGRLLGGAIGGAGGAPAAGVGAVPGAITGQAVGAFAGPFLFGALQIAGPTAMERAKRNGRSSPNAEDIGAALVTAAGSGSLDALGARFLPGGEGAVGGVVSKIGKAFFGEGMTEGAQSLVEQTGETLGTIPGLQVSGKQALGEAILGAGAGGVATGAAALAPGQRAQVEPPPLPTRAGAVPATSGQAAAEAATPPTIPPLPVQEESVVQTPRASTTTTPPPVQIQGEAALTIPGLPTEPAAPAAQPPPPDATKAVSQQKGGQPEYQGIPLGENLPADEGEIRQGEGQRAGGGGRAVGAAEGAAPARPDTEKITTPKHEQAKTEGVQPLPPPAGSVQLPEAQVEPSPTPVDTSGMWMGEEEPGFKSPKTIGGKRYAAAVMTESGLIVSGQSHDTAIERAQAMGLKTKQRGYVDADGEFLNLLEVARKEGASPTPTPTEPPSRPLPAAAVSEPAPSTGKPVEQMTPDERVAVRIKETGANAPENISAFRENHAVFVRNAIKQLRPVSAAAVDAYGIKLPGGWTQRGDLWHPPEAKPAAQAPAQGVKPATRTKLQQARFDAFKKTALPRLQPYLDAGATLETIVKEDYKQRALVEQEVRALRDTAPIGNPNHPDTIRLKKAQEKLKGTFYKTSYRLTKPDGWFKELSPMEAEVVREEQQPTPAPSPAPVAAKPAPVAQFVSIAQDVIRRRGAEMRALGHAESATIGTTPDANASGIATVNGVITIDPAKLEAATAGLDDKLSFIKKAISEEVEHLKALAFAAEKAENAKRIEALNETEPEIEKSLSETYAGWDKLSRGQRGHEIFRVILQARNDPQGAQPTTESTYRLIADFIAWLKAHVKSLKGDTAKMIAELEAMMERRQKVAEAPAAQVPESVAKADEPTRQQYDAMVAADRVKNLKRLKEDRKELISQYGSQGEKHPQGRLIGGLNPAAVKLQSIRGQIAQLERLIGGTKPEKPMMTPISGTNAKREMGLLYNVKFGERTGKIGKSNLGKWYAVENGEIVTQDYRTAAEARDAWAKSAIPTPAPSPAPAPPSAAPNNGDEVTFVPKSKRDSTVKGTLVETITNTSGNEGYHILAPLPGDPGRIVRVWKENGEITVTKPYEQPSPKEAARPESKPASGMTVEEARQHLNRPGQIGGYTTESVMETQQGRGKLAPAAAAPQAAKKPAQAPAPGAKKSTHVPSERGATSAASARKSFSFDDLTDVAKKRAESDAIQQEVPVEDLWTYKFNKDGTFFEEHEYPTTAPSPAPAPPAAAAPQAGDTATVTLGGRDYPNTTIIRSVKTPEGIKYQVDIFGDKFVTAEQLSSVKSANGKAAPLKPAVAESKETITDILPPDEVASLSAGAAPKSWIDTTKAGDKKMSYRDPRGQVWEISADYATKMLTLNKQGSARTHVVTSTPAPSPAPEAKPATRHEAEQFPLLQVPKMPKPKMILRQQLRRLIERQARVEGFSEEEIEDTLKNKSYFVAGGDRLQALDKRLRAIEAEMMPEEKRPAPKEAGVSFNEKKALEFASDPKNLIKRLQSGLKFQHIMDRAQWKLDAENKRLVSPDGDAAIVWKTRKHPDQPESYENQQTTEGTWETVKLKDWTPEPKAEAPKPAVKDSPAVIAGKKRAANAAATVAAEQQEVQVPSKTSESSVPPAEVSSFLKVEVPDADAARAKVAAFNETAGAIQKEAIDLEDALKKLSPEVVKTTGRSWERGQIKKSAPKAKVKQYLDWKAQIEKKNEAIRLLREQAAPSAKIERQAMLAKRVNDEKLPLLGRLAARRELIGEQGDWNTPVPKELTDAIEAEASKVIRSKYPDATEAEVKRATPKLAALAGHGHDYDRAFEMDADLNIADRRAQELAEFINPNARQYSVTITDFPQSLQDRINAAIPHYRPYDKKSDAIVPMTRDDLDLLKANITTERQIIASKKEEQAKLDAEEAAKKAEAAQKTETVTAGSAKDAALKTALADANGDTTKPKVMKAQGEYLQDAIAKAIKESSDESTGRIRFEVPGDGTFVIFNTTAQLKDFAERTKNAFKKPASTLPGQMRVSGVEQRKAPAKVEDAKLFKLLGEFASDDDSRNNIKHVIGTGDELMASDAAMVVARKEKNAGTPDKPIHLDAKSGKLVTDADELPTESDVTAHTFRNYLNAAPEGPSSHMEIEDLYRMASAAEALRTDVAPARIWRNKDGTLGVSLFDGDTTDPESKNGYYEGNKDTDATEIATIDPKRLRDALEFMSKAGEESVKVSAVLLIGRIGIKIEGDTSRAIINGMTVEDSHPVEMERLAKSGQPSTPLEARIENEREALEMKREKLASDQSGKPPEQRVSEADVKYAEKRLKALEDRFANEKRPDGAPPQQLSAASPEQDARYLELAKEPEKNRDELQRMVDAAAKAAGYDVGPVFHGSDKGFEVFKTIGNSSTSVGGFPTDAIGAYFSPKEADAGGFGSRLYRVFLKLENPLEMRWDSANTPGSFAEARLLRRKIKSDGYDGIHITSQPEEWIAFDPAQIKSADPITRDASGAVIPLSQRFNPESPSILYAASPESTSTKKAVQQAERAAEGREPTSTLTVPAREALIETARKKIEADPDAGYALVREINEGPVTWEVSDEQEALLAAHKRIIRTEKGKQLDIIIETFTDETSTPERRALAMERFDVLEAENDAIDRATNKTGSAWHRWGMFRRQELLQDFSFAQIEKVMRKKMGRPLEADEAIYWRNVAEEHLRLKEQEIAEMTRQKDQERLDAVNAAVQKTREEAMKDLPNPAVLAHAKKAVAAIHAKRGADLKKFGGMFSEPVSGTLSAGTPMPGVLSAGTPTPRPDWFDVAASAGAVILSEGSVSRGEWIAAMKEKSGDTKGALDPYIDELWSEANNLLDADLAELKGGETGLEKDARKVRNATKEQLVESIREHMAMDGDLEGISRFLKKLALRFIEGGITKREPLLDALHAAVKDIDPSLDRETVMDLYSDYGKFKPATTDEVKIIEAQIRSETQMARKLMDMLAGKLHGLMRGMLTGSGRVAPSDAWRQIAKQVEDAKRRGFKVKDTPTQIRSAFATARTRMRNEIADMDYAIAEKSPLPGRKNAARFSKEEQAELDALKEARRLKKEDYDKAFPRDKTAENLAVIGRALDRAISEIEAQLKAGQLYPGKSTTKLTSPEIDAKRAKLDALRNERKVLRGLDTARVEADKLAAAQKRVNELLAEKAKGWPDTTAVGTPTADTKELAALKAERDALLKQRREAQHPLKTEEEKRLNALDKLIAAKTAKLAAGDTSTKPKNQNVKTAAVTAKEAELKRLSDELATLRKNDVTRQVEQWQARLTTRRAALETKLASGDFSKAAKPKVKKPSPAIKAIQAEIDQVQQRITEGYLAAERASHTGAQKIQDKVSDIFHTMRAFMTGGELSGVLRQGKWALIAHPIVTIRGSIPAMFRAAASQESEYEELRAIQERENAWLYKETKLPLLDPRNFTAAQMEGNYRSRFASKVPIIAHSGRAYTAGLNRLRADIFDLLYDIHSKRYGTPTMEDAKAISAYVADMTGSSSLGLRGSKAADLLNILFFAPKYVWSRFRLLLGAPMWRTSPEVKRLIVEEYARVLLGIAVMYALYSAVKDDDEEIELDPRSSKFGKIPAGKGTFVDPMAGLIQSTVFLSRLTSGKVKDAKGELQPIRQTDTEKPGFGKGNAYDLITKFARSKMSPIAGSVIDQLNGTDFMGQPITVKGQFLNLVTPMTYGDIYEAMAAHGAPKGVILSMLAFFGESINTYQPKPAKVKPLNLGQFTASPLYSEPTSTAA